MFDKYRTFILEMFSHQVKDNAQLMHLAKLNMNLVGNTKIPMKNLIKIGEILVLPN